MTDYNELLKKNNFRFEKKFGQNFITDGDLLGEIADLSGIGANDYVLEIGAGAGTLTSELCKRAKKVVSYEIDGDLKPVLKESLSGYNNVEVRFCDFMKQSDSEILSAFDGAPFHVVANIPYYITTPIIMRILDSDLPVRSMTLLIQKEVAERLCARENTSDYGVITLSVNLIGDAKLMRVVEKTCFRPIPKVDSAVIKIDVNKNKYDADYHKVMKFVKVAFSMRRKTLNNCLSAGYQVDKKTVCEFLQSQGLSETVRGESLSIEQFISMAYAWDKVIKSPDSKPEVSE